MTRLFLITLLVLSSGPAYAEWVAVENNSLSPGLQTVYIDPDTIRLKGDVVFERLQDHPNNGKHLVFVLQGANRIRLCKRANS